MVTIDQAMRGVAMYADSDIIPHLPTGKGIGAGIALALIMDGGKSRILALKDHPVVQMMGIIDAEGNIDLDRLYSIARPKIEGKKIPVAVPIIGELRFDVNDLDKLYQRIKEA
nr:MAG TPA: hypothetical protein [Caudoviricetes sp.]